MDARTGEFAVFDSSGEASLVDAVGASCAVPGVWRPVTIGNRRFMDGGVRSIANADELAGRHVSRGGMIVDQLLDAASCGLADVTAGGG